MNGRIALAAPLLLLAQAAAAQSTLNISGYLDIGVYRDTAGTWNLGSIARSNIAFTGSEDLGGGLAATFALNHRFEPDTGRTEQVGKPFWHGESTVGLEGGLGSIRFGRALTAMNAQDWRFDPWSNFDRVASPAWDLWHYKYPSDPYGNSGLPEYGRLNNGIFYDSPEVDGFSVHLSTAPRQDVPPEHAADPLYQPWGVSLNYSANGISAMLARERNVRGDSDTFVGLRGDIGDLALMGVWDQSESGPSTATALSLGMTYIIGVTTLRGGWGRVEVDGVQAQETFGVGAAYALSRRTSLYVDAANKRYPDDDAYVYGLGMSHAF